MQNGCLLTLWLQTALDERISSVARATGAHRCVIRDATLGVGAAVTGARVNTLLSHTGMVATAVGADNTLWPTAGRGTQVRRQTGAVRTAAGISAR